MKRGTAIGFYFFSFFSPTVFGAQMREGDGEEERIGIGMGRVEWVLPESEIRPV